jgi:tetratricopeptide (TPR) repeat protein
MFMGDQDAAALHLQEALLLADRLGLTSTHVLVRANLTELAFKSGDLAQARVHAERALEIAQGTGMRAAAGWLLLQLSRLAARRPDLPEAQARIVVACTLALELKLPSLKAAALLALAELFEAQDRRSAARRVLAFGAAQIMLSAPDRDELHAEWLRRATVDPSEPAWPGLSVDELLRRIVVGHASAHTTLIAELG